MGTFAQRIAALGKRLMAELARRAPRSARAEPGRVQSVDQLISILQGAGVGVGDIHRVLGDSEARARFVRWQYAAISAVAEAVMMTPRWVEVRDGDTWRRDDGHRLNRLLRSVNPFMTGEELTYWTVVECQLVGRSFVRIARNRAGEPAELWPLVGAVQPIPDKDRVVAGWKETISTNGSRKEITHAREDIVYLRLPKPGDLLGGLGPAQAAGAAIRLDQEVAESNFAAMKNGLFPFAVVKFATDAAGGDPERRDQIMTELREKYMDSRNTGKPLAVGSLIDITWPPHRPREMGYAQSAETARDDILGTLRVPAAVLGLAKDVNRAAAEGMEYTYAKWRVAPLLALYYARLNQDLAEANQWSDGRECRIGFQSPVPADREQEANERDMRLRQGALTINEDRELEGRQPVAWGHEPWLPVGTAQPSQRRADGEGDGNEC